MDVWLAEEAQPHRKKVTQPLQPRGSSTVAVVDVFFYCCAHFVCCCVCLCVCLLAAGCRLAPLTFLAVSSASPRLTFSTSPRVFPFHAAHISDESSERQEGAKRRELTRRLLLACLQSPGCSCSALPCLALPPAPLSSDHFKLQLQPSAAHKQVRAEEGGGEKDSDAGTRAHRLCCCAAASRRSTRPFVQLHSSRPCPSLSSAAPSLSPPP